MTGLRPTPSSVAFVLFLRGSSISPYCCLTLSAAPTSSQVFLSKMALNCRRLSTAINVATGACCPSLQMQLVPGNLEYILSRSAV